MDPRGLGRRPAVTLVPVVLASVLLASAGAAPARGDATLVEPTLTLPSLGLVRHSADPPPAPLAAMGWGMSPQPIVRVAWYDVEGLFRSGFDPIASQVAAFFRQVGVTLIWRQGEVGTSSEDVATGEVPVILFTADTSPRRGTRPVLGSTTTNGGGPRSITVFLDPIRATLGLRPLDQPRSPTEVRQRAQAVARVIAHELVHALSPGQAHCARGLMKHSFSRADLLSPLSIGEARSVRALLATAGRAATASLSATPAYN